MTDLCRPAPRAAIRALVLAAILTAVAGFPADLAAQQAQRPTTPSAPPAWTPTQNPIQPVCVAEETAAGRNSPVVKFETRENKVYLVVQSRPNETVAVVTHETGAISFDRPVCVLGVDAIVTQPALR